MQHKSPLCSSDIIIEINDSVVIIERKFEPKGYALPGGLVEYGESIENTAIREAKEETNLDIELIELLYTYSNPSRDPRSHCISSVFIAKAKGQPQGGDDAKKAFLVPIEKLLNYHYVFDHRQIILDYLEYKKTGKKPDPKKFLSS